MERWDMKKWYEVAMMDLEALVSQDHLLRKVEQVMDYEWIYTRLEPFYCVDNGRPRILRLSMWSRLSKDSFGCHCFRNQHDDRHLLII